MISILTFSSCKLFFNQKMNINYNKQALLWLKYHFLYAMLSNSLKLAKLDKNRVIRSYTKITW